MLAKTGRATGRGLPLLVLTQLTVLVLVLELVLGLVLLLEQKAGLWL